MFESQSHCMLWARDLDRAVRWYGDTLGFEVDYHAPGEYASLQHPRAGRLALHGGGRDADIGHGPIPYFLVKDLTAAITRLRELGVEVREPQQEAESPRFTQFLDSEGNVLGIEER